MANLGYEGGYGVTAKELQEAVANGFLTKDEARLIYWAQFPQLKQQAANTPPPVA